MSWTGQNWGLGQPRFVTDLTGDGKADIVGFGRDGGLDCVLRRAAVR
jgi:hypothetical protein